MVKGIQREKKYNTSLVPRLQHEVSVSLLPQSAVGLLVGESYFPVKTK